MVKTEGINCVEAQRVWKLVEDTVTPMIQE